MLAPHTNDRWRASGAALFIVLAFVVLLTVVVFAFFSRATMARQTSKSTAAETAATILARSSLATIVSDLREEIGKAGTPTITTIVPQRSGVPSSGTPPRLLIPNLVRISLNNDAILSPGVGSRASAVNSTTNIAANGRYVSKARWNSHYLIPKRTAGDDSSEPIAGFSAPDWVIVTRNGPTPFSTWDAGLKSSSNDTYALGRYAYAVYDEGGLLDVNVAGYPTDFSPDQVGPKGILAFADLPTAGVSSWQSDNIVGWRNYATLKPAGYFASTSSASKSRFLPFSGLTEYFTLVTTRTNDFLKVPDGTPYKSQTDQAIADRQQLIKLRRSLGFSVNALQNFGTFSRERNKPTWQDSATRLAGRFPLSRFDLFANPSGNQNDIKKYFGLQYVPASDTTPEHWKYIGAEGTDDVLQPSIYTLNGNGQDPDLSVLLRYSYNVGTSTDETRAMLSIMASLIDQRDLNNNTTWIEFRSTDPAATTPEKAWGADGNPPSPEPGAPTSGVVVLNRQFRNVGELGYGYRNGSTPLDFQSPTIDARLLDLFTYNSAGIRAGLVNFNTQNAVVLAAILQGTTDKEKPTQVYFPGGRPSTSAKNTGQDIVDATSPLNSPATSSASVSRADIPNLVAKIRSSALGSSEEEKEVIARAFAELTQTRTWNLMIDVIAQSGRYPPIAGALADFVVQGEKRYWLHIAIDRFTGEVIDQQLEAVYE